MPTQNEYISCFLVDDEEDARKLLSRLLHRIPMVQVKGEAGSVDEALPLIISTRPDLLFLDVQMPEKNGFVLLESLKNLTVKPVVIFVTAHIEYAIHALKAAAFDYLLKPVSFDELAAALNRYRAEKWHDDYQNKIDLLLNTLSKPDKKSFNTRTGYIFIDPAEVIFCEADTNYTSLYMGKDRKEIVTVNLGKVEEMFLSHQFLRISRSHLINLRYLSKADRKARTCELFCNGEKIIIPVPPNQIKMMENLLNKK